MSTVFNLIENVVNEAIFHTDSNISNVQKSLLPEAVDLNYNFVRSGKYRFNNESYTDHDNLVLKIEGLRYKSYVVKNKEDAIYKMSIGQAVQENRIHPFALFLDGRHINWSEMTIVKDTRYTYLLIPRNPFKNTNEEIQNVKSIKCIYMPFNMVYTENRTVIGEPYKQIMRFTSDGYMNESGKVIYYIDHPNVVYKEYSFPNGQIDGYDLEISHDIKLTKSNFIVFKDKKLVTDEEIDVNRINLFYMNGSSDSKYKVKLFYRTDVNVPYNIINKFPNVQLAKDMVTKKVVNKNIDYKLLNTPFDFTVDKNRSYDNNIRFNFRYMTSYDTDFLTKIYEEINTIETKSYSGKEIREKVNLFGVLEMLLLKYKQKETYVMVFRNGELYKNYSNLKYGTNTFTIPIDMDELEDKDQFEFIFLKNINNYHELIRYTEENRFKEQEAFEDDELLLYCRDPKEHLFKDKIQFNWRTWFNVDFTIDEDKNVIVDEFYNNKEILYTTKNQFKYCYRNIQKESMKIRLTPDFMTSLNENQYMVFVNGRLMNRMFYRLIMPERDNVFTDPYLYSRIKFNPGDKVEVIYGPIEFKDMDYSGNLVTKIVDVTVSRDNQISFIVPYPFKLYTLKNDFMVFHEGVYVDPSRYKAKKGLIAFIDGTKLVEGEKVSFLFIYDECDMQESSIYINDDNGIYMENIHLEVTYDGQELYDLGQDRYIDYLMNGNSIMVTYHGLYVPSEYFVINRYTGMLTFAPNNFKAGDFINVILFYVPEEVEKIETEFTVKSNGTMYYDSTDLSGFPFVYHMTANNNLVEEGSAELTNSTIRNATNMIDEKTNKYLTYYGEEELSKFTIGFPYTYYYNMSIYKIMNSTKEKTEEETIKIVEDFIGSKERKYTYEDDVAKNGVIKTETKIVATKQNQTNFNSEDIEGFPIVVKISTTMKTFLDSNRQELKEKYTEYAHELIEKRLEMADNDDFDIGTYIREGKPVFIMKNGTLLVEDVHYRLSREDNRIEFVTPLQEGEKIYIITFSSKYKSIKSYEYNLHIEDETQTEYDLYNIFGSLTNAKHRFIIYSSSIVLDPRRYDIDKNCKLTFKDTKELKAGKNIRIIALYVDEEREGTYTYNYLGSSKYHKIDQIEVPFEVDTYTYDIPFPDNAEKDAGFLVMAGGVIIDPSRYIVNRRTAKITFKHQDDPIFVDNTGFKFVFLYDDMKTLTVETALGDQIDEDRLKYNIPIPFRNYFETGNQILVFDGGILVDEDRYVIDTENKLITFSDGNRLIGDKPRYVFIYHACSKNVGILHEDVSISTIRRNGYIFMNKSRLEHPLAKSLFFLFLNGKKVSLDDITNISSNIVKINRDQRTRYNLVMLSHTPKNVELDQYFKTYSNYDTLINNLEVDDLNNLFNNHRIMTDTEIKHDMNISREALINEIIRDWYGRTNFHNGQEFNLTYKDRSQIDPNILDTDTYEKHIMVTDASKFFSAPLDRSHTNEDSVQD